MDEEELQHILDQAEVRLNKGVMFFLITISTFPGSWLKKGNGRNWSDVWQKGEEFDFSDRFC